MLQLDPPIPLMTPKGRGVAHFIIDYLAVSNDIFLFLVVYRIGVENDLMWVVFRDDTGKCWTWENAQIRARQNATLDNRSYP